MQSALLWYNTFKNALVKMGFTLNPYNPCIANQVIHGRQCTICWYVDDMKVSHEKPSVVDNVIKEIEKSFGKMTVTRGAKHTFVGIDINFRGDGTVMLSMDQYIKECINIYEYEVTKTSPTPAKGTLFDGDNKEESVPLSEMEAEKFHHTVAKLLYASKRTSIDIDLAVSFLCTKVASTTKGDNDKLIRVLEYLKSCPSLPRWV